MKGVSIEFKVGFFVVSAIITLSILVFQIGGINIFNTNIYKINVIFDFVNGVSKDAPVHVAGVAVGDVKDVEIFYNNEKKKTQVQLHLIIKNSVKIPKDSVAYINTLGILGEKYVEIVPGEERKNFLREGDFIIGNNPVQLEKLTESLVDVIGDQTVRDSLRESFYNMRVATENLRQTTEILNVAMQNVKNGKGTLGKLMNNDSIYDEAEAMIVNLNEKLDKTITELNLSLNDLVKDIKLHPWKIFQKPPRVKKRGKEENSSEGENSNRGYLFTK
ncbi:MAG: MlaD family protein [Candidatus Omnitrophica bacterium]|nr:MlaD family protein [Candidatus Omnitrophota bacterium]